MERSGAMSVVPEDHALPKDSKDSGFRLLQAQRARKAAEEDASRLAVRVAQLEKEKVKSEKRIAETKKRANVIRQYRKRNEDTKSQKEQLARDRDTEVKAQADMLKEARAESSKRKTESVKALQDAKREITLNTKTERDRNEQYLAEQRLLERKAAMEHKDEIKRQQIMQQERTAAMKKKHLDNIRENYESRLAQEMDLQAAKEKDLQRMTAIELKLIEDLQVKQMEQKAAYEELEMALMGSGSKGNASVGRSTDFSKLAPAESASQEPGEAEVQKVFAAFDTDGTGTIPVDKLADLMGQLGIQLDEVQLKEATDQLDLQKAGKISYGEFIMWWNG